MISSPARIAALLVALCSSFPVAADNPPIVNAPVGAVQGEAIGALHVFKGIPYALAPTGTRRWKPPLDVPKWKVTRDATKFGPACIQPKSRSDSIYLLDLPAMSEDCLSLNIWAPASFVPS